MKQLRFPSRHLPSFPALYSGNWNGKLDRSKNGFWKHLEAENAPPEKATVKGVYATRRFQKTILERFGKPTSTDNLT
jgi:hypothetical protein